MEKIPSFILKRPEKNSEGVLQVNSDRDNPPIDDGHVACLIFVVERKNENWKMQVVNVFDKDYPEYRKMMRCIPGGRLKGGETSIVAVLNEVLEEAGTLINAKDLLPLCRITRSMRNIRGQTDKGIGKSGQFYQIIFAHCAGSNPGEIEIGETTDKDTESPQWWSLEQIIDGTIMRYKVVHGMRQQLLRLKNKLEDSYVTEEKDKLQREFDESWNELREAGDKTWLLSHVIVLLRSLECITEMLSQYVDTTKSVDEFHEHDLRCFRKIKNVVMQGEHLNAYEEIERIESFISYLKSFDIYSVIARILDKDPLYDAGAIKKILDDYDPVEPLGANRYLGNEEEEEG